MVSKGLIWGIVVVVLIVGGFFLFSGNDLKSNLDSESPDGNSGASRYSWIDVTQKSWYGIELKDINSGETFMISDFDKPVLLESFAVWCPTCTRQQRITKEFEEEVGDAVVSVSLDTDPNEDEERVREHTQENGFGWRYAVSPIEMTQALVDDFGVGFVNAPSVPMVLICEDGQARKLDSGIKKIDELKEAVASCGG